MRCCALLISTNPSRRLNSAFLSRRTEQAPARSAPETTIDDWKRATECHGAHITGRRRPNVNLEYEKRNLKQKFDAARPIRFLLESLEIKAEDDEKGKERERARLPAGAHHSCSEFDLTCEFVSVSNSNGLSYPALQTAAFAFWVAFWTPTSNI